MDRRKPHPLVLCAFLAAHLAVAALTWRDLSRRTDARVRGPKAVWRVASAANSIGWVGYWLFGRRSR